MEKKTSWFRVMIGEIGLSLVLWSTKLTKEDYFDEIRRSENRKHKRYKAFCAQADGIAHTVKAIPNKELPFGDEYAAQENS